MEMSPSTEERYSGLEKHDFAIATIYLEKDENIGGIVRSANAFAAKEVIVVGRRKFLQTGMSSARPHTNITRIQTLEEFIEYATHKRYNLCSLEIGSSAISIDKFKYPENPLIIIGNEGKGIPERILRISQMIYIPQYGQVECLNAATSASIAMFDWTRKNATLNPSRITANKFIPQL